MKEYRAGAIQAGFLCVLLLWGMTTSAQYKVSGQVMDVEGVFHDVSLMLKSNGEKKALKLTADGHFETYLDWDRIYLFSFSKPAYVTKVIEFSTFIPEQVYPELIASYEMPVRLFKVFKGVDTVFFKQPIAKIAFSEERGDFVDDRDYSLKIKYKIEQMRVSGRKVKSDQNLAGMSSGQMTKNEAPAKPAVRELSEPLMEALILDGDEKRYGLPPLKNAYPQGRTDEYFELERKVVERTIFMNGDTRHVFFWVKHSWGGRYYFTEVTGRGYRCVSRDAYEYLISANEALIQNKK